MKLMILVAGLAASLWGRDIAVRISSDSPQAAGTLLRQMNGAGKVRDLHFVQADGSAPADYKLVVQWRTGGPGFQHPTAEVQVFAADNSPLYSVSRRGFKLTRSSALSRCVDYLVRDLSQRQKPGRPN